MVSRLCQPIEGTDAARIADCLGLDPSKFHHQVAHAAGAGDDDDFLNAPASPRWTTRSASRRARAAQCSNRRRALSTSRASPRSSRGRWTATPRWRRRPKDAGDAKENRRRRQRRELTPRRRRRGRRVGSSARPLSGHALANQVRLAVRAATGSTPRRRCARTTSSRPPRRATCPCAWPRGRRRAAEPGPLPGDPKLAGVMSKVVSGGCACTRSWCTSAACSACRTRSRACQKEPTPRARACAGDGGERCASPSPPSTRPSSARRTAGSTCATVRAAGGCEDLFSSFSPEKDGVDENTGGGGGADGEEVVIERRIIRTTIPESIRVGVLLPRAAFAFA